MRNSILISFLLLLQTSQVFSLDTNTVKYLPLRVGNVWVYYGDYSFPFGHGTYYDRYKITGTIESNGRRYYSVNHLRIQISGYISGVEIGLFRDGAAIRIDSSNMNIYKNRICNSSPELLVDSLLARKYDSSNTCDYFGNRVICSDTSLYNIFGLNKQSKTFSISAFEGGNFQTYAKDFGVVQYWWGQHGEVAQYNLRGCVINGIVYGDTNLTGIVPISNEVPESFQLYQNYPNPFNSVTKIRFDIPQSLLSFGEGHGVRLIIYDLLGREITTLVNERLAPGSYEAEWNATNYPSGIYFYTLSTESFNQTKRMVLIK